MVSPTIQHYIYIFTVSVDEPIVINYLLTRANTSCLLGFFPVREYHIAFSCNLSLRLSYLRLFLILFFSFDDLDSFDLIRYL